MLQMERGGPGWVEVATRVWSLEGSAKTVLVFHSGNP